jgi:integrase
MVLLKYRKLKSGKFSLYLDISFEGKREYEFLKMKVEHDYSKLNIIGKPQRIKPDDKIKIELAEKIRNKRQFAIDEGNHGYKKKKTNLSFIQFLDEYSLDKNDDNVKRLKYNIVKYSSVNIAFEDITFQWIEGFRKFLFEILSQNSVRSYLWKLKQVLKYAVNSDIIDNHNFKESIEIPEKIEKEIFPLTADEVKLLIDSNVSFNPQIKQAFLFSCFSGLRQSDVMNLRWENLDLEKKQLKIIPIKTSNRKRNSKKAEGKTLNIQLTESAINLLKKIERNNTSDLVFFNLPKRQIQGKHLRVWGLQLELKKHLHFHLSRHSFATIGITHGIDVYDMQKLLLHSKIEQTQRYAQIVKERQTEEVKKFPKF